MLLHLNKIFLPSKKPFRFYSTGFTIFSNMSIELWIIIFNKLFVMFTILKLYFSLDFLENKFNNDKDKNEYIIKPLTQ